MVKDTLNSVFDNLKERTTNPFLGTLIVVWVVKNWKLVYSLFYFDGNFKLEDRLDYITLYFSERSFILNMIWVITITLAVLIVTYILLSLSRLLTDFYDRVVIPWISKVTDKSTVVLKIDYNQLLEEVKRLDTRLEEERVARITAQTERDEAYSRALKSEEPPISKNLEQSSDQSNLNNTLIENTTHVINNTEQVRFKRIAKLIREEVSIKEFNNVIAQILNFESININDSLIKLLLREELASLKELTGSGSNKYILTDEGRKFLRYWNETSLIIEDKLPF